MTGFSAISLKSRAVIAVTGLDWRSFLQGLVTQDVETAVEGEARFGAFLTPQGRLLYDLFVVPREDGAWLDVAAEHRDSFIQRLTMYRLRAKIEITALPVSVVATHVSPDRPQDWVADPRLSDLGWRGYGLDGDEPESLHDVRQLELGVPRPADWGTDKTYPIEANFDLLGGIDFHKGCFIGQETTSRMHRRGTVKNRMAPITFDGAAPAFGSEILNGNLRAGEVLSGREGRAMATLRLDRLDGELTIDARPVRAVIPAWLPLT